MAAGGSGICHYAASDVGLYGVLGLKKECSDADIRLAYRKLAMTWHPDRWSASGSSASVEEAKERFQEIHGAYSVLADSGKRLLYDVGLYDSDNDQQDESRMGDFLGELAEMMSQATPTESMEELQQLFVEMFHGDLVGNQPPMASGSSSARPPPSHNDVNKRWSSEIPTPRHTGGRSGSASSGSAV